MALLNFAAVKINLRSFAPVKSILRVKVQLLQQSPPSKSQLPSFMISSQIPLRAKGTRLKGQDNPGVYGGSVVVVVVIVVVVGVVTTRVVS